MTIQFREATRNARLDTIESNAGTATALRVYTGAQPANAAAANSGTLLAHMLPPSDWMAAASGGTKAKSGTWQDASADGGAADTPGHFRMYASQATFDGTITAGQVVTISTFVLTSGNP